MSGRAIDGQGRAEPSGIGDELSLLMQFLEFHRATVAWKCSDVDDQRLRQKLPPSELSLAGLLNHLAFVEDYWFSHVVASAPLREPWVSMPWGRDPDAEFHQAHKLTGIGLRRRWGEACDRSRDVLDGLIAGGSHLETAYRRPGDSSPRSLRTAAAAAALAVLIPAATMAPADAAVGKPVDIVKIRYDLPGNDGSGNRQYVQEFIQLRNVSGRPVNLTGYRVQDDGAKHTFAFPRNFVLGAGKTVEVHSGKGRATGSIQYWNTTSFVWNNDHDRATLRDGRGKVLDTCGYVGTHAKGGATKTC